MAKPKIPRAVKSEHEELHAALAAATKAGGGTGTAARAVAKLMHPHFAKEEEYALPPLGMLSSLARGRAGPQRREALQMTDKLEAELPTMLAEHKAIVGALKRLIREARREKRPDVADFAARLISHAETEEQVMYPAAILVGAYLRKEGRG